jgi:hypothetical protein
MAGNVPVVEVSRKVLPSLVVAAFTVVMPACTTAGLVNCAKFNAILVFIAKFPPAVRVIKIFKLLPIMEGVHVAPEAGVVTWHAGVLPMVGDPESVMMMAEFDVDAMADTGVNVTVAVVSAPGTWEPRVIAGPSVITAPNT